MAKQNTNNTTPTPSTLNATVPLVMTARFWFHLYTRTRIILVLTKYLPAMFPVFKQERDQDTRK
jgi:hypothetical protein